MKIAVIAANGRSGAAFVTAALEAGHQVWAGTYGDHSFYPHPNLTIVPCDAANPEDMYILVKDKDAVVSLIGHVKGSAANVQTLAITHAIRAMKIFSVRRIVSLTGTGVRFPNDKISLADRFFTIGIRILDYARVKDGIAHAKALQESELDWTIIRVAKLQNIPEHPFGLSTVGPSKSIVSRKSVAKAILQVLGRGEFIQQAPMITSEKSGTTN